MADIAEHTGLGDAHAQWRPALTVLDGMKQPRRSLSAEDEAHLQTLRSKAG